MSNRIVYQVNELQAETSRISSRLQTSDPMLAFADYILKAKSPVQNVQLSKSLRSLLKFSTYPSLPKFAAPGQINIGWAMTTKGLEKPSVIASLNSVYDNGLPDRLHPDSDERYRSPYYITCLKNVRELLKEISHNDIDLCQILIGCALIDHRHFLWSELYNAS